MEEKLLMKGKKPKKAKMTQITQMTHMTQQTQIKNMTLKLSLMKGFTLITNQLQGILRS